MPTVRDFRAQSCTPINRRWFAFGPQGVYSHFPHEKKDQVVLISLNLLINVGLCLVNLLPSEIILLKKRTKKNP